MANEIVKVIENKEDGLHCNIAVADKGGFNVVFIDTDANQMIGGTCGVKTIEKAIEIANEYLGIN